MFFSSAVAYAAWAQAFKKADKASSVSNYMFVTPFLTSLMGYVFLGERLDGPTILGGAVILLGVFLFNFGGIFAERPPKGKGPGAGLNNRRKEPNQAGGRGGRRIAGGSSLARTNARVGPLDGLG